MTKDTPFDGFMAGLLLASAIGTVAAFVVSEFMLTDHLVGMEQRVCMTIADDGKGSYQRACATSEDLILWLRSRAR